jgi:cold shock CspA family protein
LSKGKVTEFSVKQGCGRIVDSSTGESLVVYANSLDLEKGQELQEGQAVEFQIEYHRSQNWAIYVRIV